MFGRNTYSVVIGVGPAQDGDGKWHIQITKYDVRLEKREIATTDNGKSRTPEAIKTTKEEHEPLHDKHMDALQREMQNKVVKTGLTTRPQEEMQQKEVEKLGNQFESINKREQEACKQGGREWNKIIEKETNK